MNIMAENDSNMIDLVLTHLTHPWGPLGFKIGVLWSIILKIVLWIYYTITHAVLSQSAGFGEKPILGHPKAHSYS